MALHLLHTSGGATMALHLLHTCPCPSLCRHHKLLARSYLSPLPLVLPGVFFARCTCTALEQHCTTLYRTVPHCTASNWLTELCYSFCLHTVQQLSCILHVVHASHWLHDAATATSLACYSPGSACCACITYGCMMLYSHTTCLLQPWYSLDTALTPCYRPVLLTMCYSPVLLTTFYSPALPTTCSACLPACSTCTPGVMPPCCWLCHAWPSLCAAWW